MLRTRALAIAKASSSRTPVFARRWLNGPTQGPHTTYFQQPPSSGQEVKRPPRRWIRGMLLSTVFFGLGFYTGGLIPLDIERLVELNTSAAEASYRMLSPQETEAIWRARSLGGTVPGEASLIMRLGCRLACYKTFTIHTITLGSNFPNEDAFSSMTAAGPDSEPLFSVWGVYDGHAGAKVSRKLSEFLPPFVMQKISKQLEKTGNVYTDEDLRNCLTSSFEEIDAQILAPAHEFHEMSNPGVETRAAAQFADQGSCGLVACYDIKRSKVHVANTGDSRAVLGSWDDEQGRYIAIPMSTDHTGFNKDEVERLQKEHPGETVVDEKTGRIFGLAVTRAFGDMRWKLPEHIMSSLHQRFLVSPPRPGGVIKTPPYLTARPEVSCFQPKVGKNPDFLILATDGLWDQLSNDQAVDLVQKWLDRYRPKDMMLDLQSDGGRDVKYLQSDGENGPFETCENVPFETYYDEKTKTQRWHNSEEYFTTKDNHCGMHLIRNALGGNRDGLLATMLDLPPHRSRDVRDDITATVIFFGADTTGVKLDGPGMTGHRQTVPMHRQA